MWLVNHRGKWLWRRSGLMPDDMPPCPECGRSVRYQKVGVTVWPPWPWGALYVDTVEHRCPGAGEGG